ncbi:MAG TPA: 5'-nucleotidase C-terminal domain-containing protein [Phycisphaerales bacterium]|nr:5'-nucleotidase C-terminal domain-containing protein [Phycisphaerales bacterium]HMP36996.1 5'-nucleotidase C-terminal domain-containing protein [Phycisphaerales bacterium]
MTTTTHARLRTLPTPDRPALRHRAATSAIAGALLVAGGAFAGPETHRLTILHNNDGESRLINAGGGLADFGGIARFATVVNQLRAQGEAEGGVMMLSSGDNFLAGPEWNASLANGVPYFDAIGMQLIGYDAICLGNHDFDFGPPILANFVESFTDGVPLLSSNLDFSGEPVLQTLFDAGRIARSVVVVVDGREVGVVGATTPDLPFISSPGNVVVDPAVLERIQEEVEALQSKGVQRIIVITHLQGISVELALVGQLRGVDVLIAGGGSELLWNPGTLLVPGDDIDANMDGVPDLAIGPYPLLIPDADGRIVPVVTTRGDYRYVGRLIVDFDSAGEIVGIDAGSGIVRVAGGAQPDAVLPDPVVQALVVDPVAAALAELAANIIATSEVPLDGTNTAIRSRETNLGNLCADSMLWQARELAPEFGLPIPAIALQNGGGIRNNNVIPAGEISELTTFSILPFANFVAILPSVPAATIKDVLENAVSRIAPPPGFPSGGNGRFAQVAGLSFEYVVDIPPGSRVRNAFLDDGTPLVLDGVVPADAPAIAVATINFLANGGDEYPLAGLPFTALGVSYQQALANYLAGPLAGEVLAAQYPEEGEGRIVRIEVGADLDGNGTVDAADLAILIGQWGGPGSADLNGDGAVNAVDLGILLAKFSG